MPVPQKPPDELSDDKKADILSSEEFNQIRNTIQEQADRLLLNVGVLEPTPALVEKYVQMIDTNLAYMGGIPKEVIREMLAARLSDLVKKGEGDTELILKTLAALKHKGKAAA